MKILLFLAIMLSGCGGANTTLPLTTDESSNVDASASTTPKSEVTPPVPTPTVTVTSIPSPTPTSSPDPAAIIVTLKYTYMSVNNIGCKSDETAQCVTSRSFATAELTGLLANFSKCSWSQSGSTYTVDCSQASFCKNVPNGCYNSSGAFYDVVCSGPAHTGVTANACNWYWPYY